MVLLSVLFLTILYFSYPLITPCFQSWAAWSLTRKWSQKLDVGLDANNLGLSIITAIQYLEGKRTVVSSQVPGRYGRYGVYISFLAIEVESVFF
jgi:hypothetical protein